MAGCCDDVQDLLSSVNDPDKYIRIVYVGCPDALCRSSGRYVCECRVPPLEGVRIGEAHHVYSWGNPDEANPDRNACHVSSGGGIPTVPFRVLSFNRFMGCVLNESSLFGTPTSTATPHPCNGNSQIN